MRKTQKIICKICNKEFSSAGFGNHLKSAHNISVDDYVKKYGEYRINKLKSQSVVGKKYKCVLDTDDKEYTERALTFHLKKRHNISKEEYIVKYLNDGKHGICECECGGKTKAVSYEKPYFNKFLPSHNVYGKNNPMFSKKHDDKTKEKMSNKAKLRCEKAKNNNKILNWHSKESIEKRSENYSITMARRRCKEKNVTLLSSSEDLKNKIFKFKCNKCGTIHEEFGFSNFICEKCFPKVRSKYESELKEFLNELNVEFISNNRKLLDNKYEIDFYIPKYNIGIEFNGLYYHSENAGCKDKKYHINKKNLCNEKNINLIQIFEDEWVNKKEILKSKIRNKLKVKPNKKIYARNTVIKEINSKLKNEFLENNHIQGKDKSKIKLGCFYENELVSVMTFSELNISKGNKKQKNVIELSRFCSDINSSCIGTFSKLLSYFKKHYPHYNKIITYADKRFSFKDDNVYQKVGFNFVDDTPPNYWYFYKSQLKRLHRFNFPKHKIISDMNGDPTLTEWENMKLLKFDRIWDCGNFKYELELDK